MVIIDKTSVIIESTSSFSTITDISTVSFLCSAVQWSGEDEDAAEWWDGSQWGHPRPANPWPHILQAEPPAGQSSTTTGWEGKRGNQHSSSSEKIIGSSCLPELHSYIYLGSVCVCVCVCVCVVSLYLYSSF